MHHLHVALGHDRHQVAAAPLVREASSDTQNHNGAIKVTALDQVSLVIAGKIPVPGVAAVNASCARIRVQAFRSRNHYDQRY